jgi:hypothetical protein
MNSNLTRTTKSARRKLVLALLTVLVITGLAAFTVLAAPARPDFSLAASPSSQTVAPSGAVTYSVTITRTNGFTGSVTLSASGVPSGASASWKLNTGPSSANTIVVPSSQTTATLTVQTASSTPVGTSTITIGGTSGSLSHQTSVSLTVGTSTPTPPSVTSDFTISGGLTSAQLLSPGSAFPLNLTVTNPYGYALKITNLTVQVDTTTSKSGCSGTTNYKVVQYRGAYPMSAPANASTTLTALGVADRDKPQLSMNDLASSQETCKGAQLTLRYSGTATK